MKPFYVATAKEVSYLKLSLQSSFSYGFIYESQFPVLVPEVPGSNFHHPTLNRFQKSIVDEDILCLVG